MKERITVVSLGPGDPELLNAKTLRALREGGRLFLRTGQHPMADWLQKEGIPYETLDRFYETSEDFDQLTEEICRFLLQEAVKAPLVYAVADALLDRTVIRLKEQLPASASLTCIPGVGQAACWLSVPEVRPSGADLRVVAASQIAALPCDRRTSLLVTEIDSFPLAGEVKARLTEVWGDDYPALLLQGEESRAFRIPLYGLDRQKQYDHRTALFVSGAAGTPENLSDLWDLIAAAEAICAREEGAWEAGEAHRRSFAGLRDAFCACEAALKEDSPDDFKSALEALLMQLLLQASQARAYDEFTWSELLCGVGEKIRLSFPDVFSSPVPPDATDARTGNA